MNLHKLALRAVGAAAAALVVSSSLAIAQAPAGGPPVRVRATIEKVDGDMLTVKMNDGSSATIKVAADARVFQAVAIPLADVKPNSYIAVTAIPQADGSQRATEVFVFGEAQRGLGEGSGPWDRPNTTMTNATVDTTVAATDGQVLTVKFKGQEKKIIVPPTAKIITNKPATVADLKPGAKIFIFAATKNPDGTLSANNITIGREA